MDASVEVKGAPRVSLEQRSMMLRFMKAHPALNTGKFAAPDRVNHKKRLLAEMTAQLNSCPNGPSKTGDKWMKSWQDWRTDVKSKAAEIKRHAITTGGGPATKLSLTELEEELLAFLGPVVVSGHNVTDVLQILEASGDPQVPVPALREEIGNFSVMPLDLNDDDSILNTLPFSTPLLSPSTLSTVSEPASVASSWGSSSGKKRKRTETETSSVSTEEERFVKVCDVRAGTAKEHIELTREQINLTQEQINLTRKQVELQRESYKLNERYATAFEQIADSIQEYVALLKNKN